MDDDQELKFGDFKIASRALEFIAGLAATEVDGVTSLSGGMVESIADWLRKGSTKGVKVSLEDKEINVDVHLCADYGYVIKEMAEKVQLSVKEALEGMTGWKVRGVNIFIDGLNFPPQG